MRSLVLGDLMTTHVKTMRERDARSSADRDRVASEVHRDEAGALLGVVTTTDFVELAHRALAGLDIHQPNARA